MSINTFNHYYYMEIFKGEEGETMLHNKSHNGFLLSKIIKKNNKDERDILLDDFPKYDDKKDSLYNNYNDFSRKLLFNSSESDKCENGCYLLITYYSPETKLKNIYGIEYTLLARIWDEEEFTSQIVNIPLNEYVFGVIEPLFSSINAHYYSAYIPEDNDIIIEFHGRNIHALAKKGLIKINIMKKPYDSIILTNDIDIENSNEIEDEKLIIKLNKEKLDLENFEKEYLSFTFIVLDEGYSNKLINHYYFRIIQETSKNIYSINLLDTNKENLCQTSKLDQYYVCYFLLKNDYLELYNSFSIYAYGSEKINYYNAWLINQIDYYSIDIQKSKKIYRKIQGNFGHFKLDFNETFNYILLEITSNFKEYIEVFFNFDGEFMTSSSFDIYSYHSFFLKNNSRNDFFFNYGLPNKYSVIINNTSGDGYIFFNQKCKKEDKKIFISDKKVLSFIISKEIKSIHLFSENNLFFNIKIKNIIDNDFFEEVYFGKNFKNINIENTGFYKAYLLIIIIIILFIIYKNL